MKRFIRTLSLIVVLALLTACTAGQKQDPEVTSEPNYTVEDDDHTRLNSANNERDLLTRINTTLYFYDESNDVLTPEVRNIVKPNSEEGLFNQIIRSLVNGPQTGGLQPVIWTETDLIKVERAENILTVNLSGDFLKSDNLLIARVALTNTLTELEGIKYVKIYIDGDELTDSGDSDGDVLGLLTKHPNKISDIQAQVNIDINDEVRYIDRVLHFRDNQSSYLLPEVRSINVANKPYAQAIVDELIRGPAKSDEGIYPTLPEGTLLNKTETLTTEDGNGVALYFSNELKGNFSGGPKAEKSMLASLVYSLTTLPEIGFIKIHYDDGSGNYIDTPIYSVSLRNVLKMEQFPDYVGRRVRVYFGDSGSELLVPEFRAVSSDSGNIAEKILTVLASDSINPNNERVIPSNILASDFKISVTGSTAIVIVPKMYTNQANDNTITRDLYAIVNSITDPANSTNIRQVQFVLEGQKDNIIKRISLNDPLVMNAALIKDKE
ncbi:MAG TPA: GerMN domain-containing protein [Bacillota bacterium]|nr:GerMN domain-containing protein [Bacillota bacterium]